MSKLELSSFSCLVGRRGYHIFNVRVTNSQWDPGHAGAPPTNEFYILSVSTCHYPPTHKILLTTSNRTMR